MLASVEPLFSNLMRDLQKNSRRRVYNYELSGKVEYDEFYPDKSKLIIDEIDRVLAKHYGFTDEELDFIINYDASTVWAAMREEPTSESGGYRGIAVHHAH